MVIYANTKEKIAVFDPSTSGAKLDMGSIIAVRELISQTVVNTNVFRLVERSYLEKIMQEQQFNNSGAVSESDATKIGELAGADKIILSVLTPASDKLLLAIKVIDVESAQVFGQGTEIFPKGQLFEKIETITLKAIRYNGNNQFVSNISSKNEDVVIKETLPKTTTEIKEKEEKPAKPKKEAWLKTPTYKGFGDFAFVIGEDAFGILITTTHGVQINPYIYVGGGLGVYYDLDIEDVGVPIYADFKVNALKGRISPVLDVRLGYSAGGVSGLYASVMPGCQFYLKGKKGLTLSLGFEYLGSAEDSYSYYGDGWYTYTSTEDYPVMGCSIKLAFDF